MLDERMIKRFLHQVLTRIIFLMRWAQAIFYDPIVICSMGKVGSRAMHASLLKENFSQPIFHTHYLSIPHILESKKIIRATGSKASLWGLAEGQYLYYLGRLTWGRRRWKVITMMREPIARDISDMFQNMHHFPHLNELAEDELVPAALVQLKKDFVAFDEKTNYTASWFEKEIEAVFGLDIYVMPFDHTRGYSIYQTENADILVIRQENLSECAAQAIHEFLGIKDFQLLRVNDGTTKSYKDIYRQVKESLVLDKNTLDKVYASRYVRYFYTDAEIAKFRQHWISNNR